MDNKMTNQKLKIKHKTDQMPLCHQLQNDIFTL